MKTDYLVKTEDVEFIIEVNESFNERIVDLLVKERKAQKKTQQDVADFTGIQRANIARIENKRHATSIDILEKYAECLGKKLEVRLVEQ